MRYAARMKVADHRIPYAYNTQPGMGLKDRGQLGPQPNSALAPPGTSSLSLQGTTPGHELYQYAPASHSGYGKAKKRK